jgi:hypothetical protein
LAIRSLAEIQVSNLVNAGAAADVGPLVDLLNLTRDLKSTVEIFQDTLHNRDVQIGQDVNGLFKEPACFCERSFTRAIRKSS